jgi:hypothetical protein
MGPIGCPEPSVQNYHSALRNIPEKCRSKFNCALRTPEMSSFDKRYVREIFALLDVTQRTLVESFRRFGTTYGSQEVQEDCLTVEDGTDKLSRNVDN